MKYVLVFKVKGHFSIWEAELKSGLDAYVFLDFNE